VPPEPVPPAPYSPPRLPPRTRPASQLAASGITVAFGGVLALDGVDFAVSPGEVCALIGPNGSGKTTLLNCFSGIVVPRAGEVLLDGVRLAPVAPHRAYRRARMGIARTFQTPRVQTELSVLDNVVQGLFWRGPRMDGGGMLLRRGRQRARQQRALVLLRAVGLEHRAHLPAVGLSHGERRLLEVARALVGEPGVVLVDEPAAGLSAEESRHLADVLRACREWGCATVLIEHDLSLVLEVADRVVVLDRGRVIARGTPTEVCTAPVVAEAFMGPVG